MGKNTCIAPSHFDGVYLVKMANSSTTEQRNNSEKCYDPQDSTLTFVDGEDDMDCK